MPKITMLSALFAVAASVKLLLNGNLISLTCNLVDPLCERGTIVAREAKSVGLHPAGFVGRCRG